ASRRIWPRRCRTNSKSCKPSGTPGTKTTCRRYGAAERAKAVKGKRRKPKKRTSKLPGVVLTQRREDAKTQRFGDYESRPMKNYTSSYAPSRLCVFALTIVSLALARDESQ